MDELQTLRDFRTDIAGAGAYDPARERTLRAIRARIETEARPPKQRRRRLLVPGLAVAALAAALAILPLRGSTPSLVDQALAAIGSGDVLHVVAEQPTGARLVDLRTGSATPVVQQEEIWFDESRGLRRDVTRVDGQIVDDVLQTPAGGFTPHGIVYDCTWIAAHPQEATKARVSCNPSGDNGTTPHVVPRPKPTLDPGLAGFADGYRGALASGAAKAAGSGVVDGRAVDWLVFGTIRGAERVALDAATHKPVLVDEPEGLRMRIASIESADYAADDFRRPTPDETPAGPSSGAARDGKQLPPDGASIAAAYPGALWAGGEIGGLPLASATVQTLVSSYADGRPPQTGRGLQLHYGSTPSVEVSEAPSPVLAMAYMWPVGHAAVPPPGMLYSDGSPGFAVGFVSVGGTFVTIRAPGDELLLAAARALTPAG